ncbi:hypothetical protein C5471_23365 [Photorhabdus tasmaniensis]|uniref:Recombinase domain-containing protein n=1 Tax=Photorhabdus tasmaniensis TaxID=1004159 RepID=A0ABX0GMI5_9GAMM|nr:hypothetical protein [Photorhabdus tasmaniensis]
MKTYIMKVALRGISPMVWRRFKLSGETSLAALPCKCPKVFYALINQRFYAGTSLYSGNYRIQKKSYAKPHARFT